MEELPGSSRQVEPRTVRWLVPIAAVVAVTVWLVIAPAGALGKLDSIGYAVCHRIEERSFHAGGRQLPLCARCTGEFAAAAVAILFQSAKGGRATRFPTFSLLIAFGGLFLAFAVDGLNSFMALLDSTAGPGGAFPTVYQPSGTLRVLTGSGMGIAMAGVLYPAVSQSLWRRADEGRTLTWRSLGILAALVGGMDALILTEQPVFLYAAGALSALGVLGLLTMVFGMVWVTIMRQENSFSRTRQLWLPACAGLTLALLLIVGIDLLRYNMTGTWTGFPGLTG